MCVCGPSLACLCCRRRFYSFTLAIFASILAPALFLTNFGDVLALTGSFASSMLGYVMPGLLFFKLGRAHGDVGWNATSLLNGFLVLFGVCAGVMGTVQTIQGDSN
jgi:amino acid permease